jgi:hypothetical protein
MENNKSVSKAGFSLVDIVSTAIRIPGVKVNRESLLREQFKDLPPEHIQLIVEKGPVEANCSRSELRKIAKNLVKKKTLISSSASFIAGIPGGLAMAATIPADMLQFYGAALGLAQELAYIYGEGDLWSGDLPDTEKVTNQLILYCGVMLGASGAAQTIRVLSSSLAKQALKKLPQKALTKTFYYPIVKSIAKAFSAKMTKEVFAKGVSKVIPVIGGVVSGGVTFATLMPMGTRLTDVLEEAHFSYTQDYFEADWSEIVEVYEKEKSEEEIISQSPEAEIVTEASKSSSDFVFEKIKEAKKMLEVGVLSEEEFADIKAKLIAQL